MAAARKDYRNVPYRPPRPVYARAESAGALFRRFAAQHLWPHRWSIGACILLVSLNTCSVYLMACYGRFVVDHILVIGPPESAGPSGRPERIAASDRTPPGRPPPENGAASEFLRSVSAAARPPNGPRLLWIIFGLYTATILALNVTARMAQRRRVAIGRAITGQLRESLHRKVMDLSRSYHEAQTPGQLMARILSDVSVVQGHLTSTILDAGSHAATFIIGLSLLFTQEWRIALIALAAMPPYALVYRRAAKRIKQLSAEARHTNMCLFGLAAQKFDGIKAVFGYGRERHEKLNFFRLNACLLRDALIEQRHSAGMNSSTLVITSVATTLILLFGVRLVQSGEMTLGEMMYIYGIAANLFQPVLGLTRLTIVFSRTTIILQRIMQVLDEPLEIEEALDAVPFAAPLRKGIVVRKLSFAYSNDDERVLDGIDLDIPAGRWTCIMGPSGGGKSTLLGLLARLYEPTSGEITFDGLALSQIRFHSLRRHLALVPQEPEVFSGTIRDNITYGHPDAQPADIMAAARSAEMHDFIMSLPVKYETLVGEKGMTLSGGQRQRISLARALLSGPEILLLDDCTSSLDAQTEQRVQETLARLLQGRTAVIVTQRVSMARRCHHIAVIEGGRVTQQGTHEQLAAKPGFYARLVAQQTAA